MNELDNFLKTEKYYHVTNEAGLQGILNTDGLIAYKKNKRNVIGRVYLKQQRGRTGFTADRNFNSVRIVFNKNKFDALPGILSTAKDMTEDGLVFTIDGFILENVRSAIMSIDILNTQGELTNDTENLLNNLEIPFKFYSDANDFFSDYLGLEEDYEVTMESIMPKQENEDCINTIYTFFKNQGRGEEFISKMTSIGYVYDIESLDFITPSLIGRAAISYEWGYYTNYALQLYYKEIK